MKCYGGAPGNRGASLFPEGRTYSPPAKAGGGSPPVGWARALSEGGLRLLREPPDDTTDRLVLLSSPTQLSQAHPLLRL